MMPRPQRSLEVDTRLRDAFDSTSHLRDLVDSIEVAEDHQEQLADAEVEHFLELVRARRAAAAPPEPRPASRFRWVLATAAGLTVLALGVAASLRFEWGGENSRLELTFRKVMYELYEPDVSAQRASSAYAQVWVRVMQGLDVVGDAPAPLGPELGQRVAAALLAAAAAPPATPTAIDRLPDLESFLAAVADGSLTAADEQGLTALLGAGVRTVRNPPGGHIRDISRATSFDRIRTRLEAMR